MQPEKYADIKPTPGGKGLYVCGDQAALDAALADLHRTWDKKRRCFSLSLKRQEQVYKALRSAGFTFDGLSETPPRTVSGDGSKRRRVSAPVQQQQQARPPGPWSCNRTRGLCHLDPSGPHKTLADCRSGCGPFVPTDLLSHVADFHGGNELAETEKQTHRELKARARDYWRRARQRARENEERVFEERIAPAVRAVRTRDAAALEQAVKELRAQEASDTSDSRFLNWHRFWWRLLDEAMKQPDNVAFVLEIIAQLVDDNQMDVTFWEGDQWHSVARYALENASDELLDTLGRDQHVFDLVDSPYDDWTRWLLDETYKVERNKAPEPGTALARFLEAQRHELWEELREAGLESEQDE